MLIEPDDDVSDIITIGQELMKAMTMIFNFKDQMIGFYDKNKTLILTHKN
jgi:hypothetical protein